MTLKLDFNQFRYIYSMWSANADQQQYNYITTQGEQLLPEPITLLN